MIRRVELSRTRVTMGVASKAHGAKVCRPRTDPLGSAESRADLVCHQCANSAKLRDTGEYRAEGQHHISVNENTLTALIQPQRNSGKHPSNEWGSPCLLSDSGPNHRRKIPSRVRGVRCCVQQRMQKGCETVF
jgi:hypothetical protein